ncbi:lysozyme inhibitor LprI family protein [Mesorhizobium sp. YR577]|uniref:lysozyme inhibitor LprI family protein n=1 Tax=Mesorhizobium sp. YR577 TaxID=1884373 RepID=UPI0008E899E1|nr:lysozyme inhibitor LprI family protein [Mesorhizobium sp. YR577]SFU23036.1 Uncharacterized conserved protein YecT, DUF1311 family [Mesorhizobium sp. YR577]
MMDFKRRSMKTAILTVAVVLAMPAFAFAQDKCYDAAKDQPALNACADAVFKKSDKKLNELYQQIETGLNDDTDIRKLLVQVQWDWIKFRDAECSFQAAASAGGSVMPLLIAQCMDGLTQSRVKNFEGYLKCEEGDMSCPVPAAAVSAPAAPAASTPATAQGDMGFDVNVTLSKKAATKLAVEKEGIVIFADYYGDPKKSAEKHTNEIGQISLEQQDEREGGHAHINGAKVDMKRLDWLAGPAKVNVNVASARKSSADNILGCDFIDGGPLSHVQMQPVTPHCALIEENYDTELKP